MSDSLSFGLLGGDRLLAMKQRFPDFAAPTDGGHEAAYCGEHSQDELK